MKKKILLIDDDRMLATANTMILKEQGFDAKFLLSLTDAKEQIRQWQPDLIVLDVEIGKDNGIEAVPELKKIAPYTPIIFISSHVGGKEINKAIKAGGEYYIKKPFETEELETYISKLLPQEPEQTLKMEEGYQLETTTRYLHYGTTVIKKLSQKEYDLFILLYNNKGTVLSRERIIEEVWPEGTDINISLNNFISKLRKILSIKGMLTIETIPGKGYRLNKQNNTNSEY